MKVYAQPEPADLYFGARNTLINMMEARGYQLEDGSDFSTLRLTRDEFDVLYRGHASEPNKLDITGIVDTNGKNVLISFIEWGKTLKLSDDKQGGQSFMKVVAKGLDLANDTSVKYDVKDTTTFINNLANNYHVIIVHNPSSTKLFSQPNKNIEFFQVARVAFDISNNENSPQHIIMTSKEVDTLVKEKNISVHNCAKIASNDPFVLYYNAQPGQLIKIIREGKELYYRSVVKVATGGIGSNIEKHL